VSDNNFLNEVRQLRAAGQREAALKRLRELATQEILLITWKAIKVAGELVALGELDNAQRIYEKIIEGDPDNLWARVGEASVYRKRGDRSRAVALLEALLERYPDQLHLRLQLADDLRLLARHQKAQSQINAILAAEPDNFPARLRQASMSDRLSEWVALNASVDRHISKLGRSNVIPYVVDLAVATGHLEAMRQISLELGTSALDSQDLVHLARMLPLLHRYCCFDGLEPILEKARVADPGDPRLCLLAAKLDRLRGKTAPDLVPLFGAMREHESGYLGAIRWLGAVMFADGEINEAKNLYGELLQRAGLDRMDRLRFSHLAIKSGRSVAQEESLAGPEQRLTKDDLGQLGECMDSLLIPINGRHEHGSTPTPEQINKIAAESLHRLSTFLDKGAGIDVSICRDVATKLNQVAEGYFKSISILQGTTPVVLSDAYGTLDGLRFKAVYDMLMRHIAALGSYALLLDNPLRGASAVYPILDVAELLVNSLLKLDKSKEATGLVEQLHRRSGRIGRPFLAYLLEKCALDRGEIEGARRARAQGGCPPEGESYQLLEFAHWASEEHLLPNRVAYDQDTVGTFEYVRSDGAVHSHEHTVPGVEVRCVKVESLRIRASLLTIGPHGTMLKPHAWHLSAADYPYDDPALLNRSAAGATMQLGTDWKIVNEPVVVLGNMDPIAHRNYYHWIALVLSRIQLVLDKRLLEKRKLLLPVELTSWMMLSLHSIGISADAIRSYSRTENLVLTDALLLSPIEFLSPTLVCALRNNLWKRAKVEPTPQQGTGRLLYISRKNALRRPLINEEQLSNLALRHGFEVVMPEDYSFLEQVRMFADAKAVAGPAGAALTNLIFAREGTRVLSLSKEEEAYPTFVDISVILSQNHRWLLGRTDPAFYAGHPLNTPYQIQPEMFERELQWLKGMQQEE